MLYFAETEYKHILYIEAIEGLEDIVLVSCEQAVEKYLKHLIQDKIGQVQKTQNLPYLINCLKEQYPEMKNYMSLARFLKDCYFERRYENDDYIELEKSEYEEYLQQSLGFIAYLRGLNGLV